MAGTRSKRDKAHNVPLIEITEVDNSEDTGSNGRNNEPGEEDVERVGIGLRGLSIGADDEGGARISAATTAIIDPDDNDLRLTQNGVINMDSPRTLVTKTAKSRLHNGMFHSSRLGSFIANAWPRERVKKNGVACTPQELAFAGLEYVSKGSARCFVCLKLVSNLEARSDPWECHRLINPECPLIKLGKPLKPDGYTLKQFFTLLAERQANYTQKQYLELESSVELQLEEFLEAENEETETNAEWDDSF